MDFLKRFGIFVGWLSGSVAGLAALLYAIGFVATLANLSELGVDFFLINYDSIFFISRGANAILYLALEVGNLLLLIAPVLVIVPPMVLGLRRAYRWGARRWHGMGDEATDRLRRAGLILAYLLLFVYLYATLDRYVGEFGAYAGVSGLLFDSAGTAIDKGKLVLPALCDADTAKSVMRVLIIAAAGALAVTFLAARVTRGWRLRVFLLAPFVGVLFMMTFLLPSTYGILLVQRDLAPITAKVTSEGTPRTYYLISKTAGEFVLWDPIEKRVTWASPSTLTVAAIGRKQPLTELLPGLQTMCRKNEEAR